MSAAAMVRPENLARVDLGALRKKIIVSLGPDKARRYWDTLKQFVRFKLSKDELDVHAREALGADNIPLHNELVRGIFQNALLGTISPPAHEAVLEDPLDSGRPQKRPKHKKPVAPGMAMPGGAQLKPGQAMPGSGQDRMTHDTIWLNAQEMHRTQWRICDGGDLYDESWELPSFVGLRHKMRRRGQEQGIAVAHESIECLQRTLEAYIKNIIFACTEIAAIRRSAFPETQDEDEGAGTVSMADMLVAIKFTPQLLGQESVLNLERICMGQNI